MYTFIETNLFSRLVSEYLSDEEFRKLQETLYENPNTGDLIRGSGGLRKLRWTGSGRGKRGGTRIIYYARTREGEIWLITIYPKNVSDNIPASTLKKIAEEIKDG